MTAVRLALVAGVIAILAVAAIDVLTVDAATVDGVTIGQAAPQGDAPPAADDTRLPVQLWTVLAAGGAAAVGLVFFVVRVMLGRVGQPPPEEDGGEH